MAAVDADEMSPDTIHEGFPSEASEASPIKEGSQGGFSSDSSGGSTPPPRPQSRSRSRSPRLAERDPSPLQVGIPWPLFPAIYNSMKGWQQPLVELLQPVREEMYKNFLLLRPMTHDSLLSGNLTEHYAFKAFPHAACIESPLESA